MGKASSHTYNVNNPLIGLQIYISIGVFGNTRSVLEIADIPGIFQRETIYDV